MAWEIQRHLALGLGRSGKGFVAQTADGNAGRGVHYIFFMPAPSTGHDVPRMLRASRTGFETRSANMLRQLSGRTRMKRIVLIAASSAAALAATLAIAQPQPIPAAGGDRDQSRQERSETREQRRNEWRERRAQQAQERLNDRLAKLREEMKLKPEQVPLFDKVEAVLKQRLQDRGARIAAMRERREALRHADIMERIEAMASSQGERAARSKELADAVRPLWQTLSDEQKTVARRTVREAFAEGRERYRAMREYRGDWRGGHERYDRDDRGERYGRSGRYENREGRYDGRDGRYENRDRRDRGERYGRGDDAPRGPVDSDDDDNGND
jgi:hypothetical protein